VVYAWLFILSTTHRECLEGTVHYIKVQSREW